MVILVGNRQNGKRVWSYDSSGDLQWDFDLGEPFGGLSADMVFIVLKGSDIFISCCPSMDTNPERQSLWQLNLYGGSYINSYRPPFLWYYGYLLPGEIDVDGGGNVYFAKGVNPLASYKVYSGFNDEVAIWPGWEGNAIAAGSSGEAYIVYYQDAANSELSKFTWLVDQYIKAWGVEFGETLWRVKRGPTGLLYINGTVTMLAQYNETSLNWAKNSTDIPFYVRDIIVDSNDNCYVVGYDGPDASNLWGCFYKYNSAGVLQWALEGGYPCNSACITPNDDVVVCLQYYNMMHGEWQPREIAVLNPDDGFPAKLFDAPVLARGIAADSVIVPPRPPEAESPIPDEATEQPIDMEFKVKCNEQTGKYELYVDINDGNGLQLIETFGACAIDQSYITHTYRLPAWATTYSWRVDTSNDSGTTTGPVWTFETAPPPRYKKKLVAACDNKFFYENN